jgi:catechol 2,3-dioxygenase-like lactoylglutathione lyase family enzyme
MNRRQAAAALLAGAFSARAAEQPFAFTSLDHVEFFASDVQKAVAFYARVFGNTVLKNNRTTRRYLKLGSSYIAIENAGETGLRIDHFCAGIKGFQISGVHSYLMEHGVEYKDYPSGRDLAVTDLDGSKLQLATDNGWNLLLGGTASAETIAIEGEPVFKPIGIDHLLLNVSDPEKSAAFFEKVLGPVTQRNNNRIWFQVGSSRIGLLETPLGQRAGVNHYCVLCEKFDYAGAVKRLGAVGAKVETPEVAGAPDFRDSDGYRVQVMAKS